MENTTHLYALVREGYDDPYFIEYYMDEVVAKNKLITFALRTRMTACVYVYELASTPNQKLKMVGMFDLATDENDSRFFKIWMKQEALLRSDQHISTTYLLANPDTMYDCLKYIECDM
jgi:hypothetical protein